MLLWGMPPPYDRTEVYCLGSVGKQVEDVPACGYCDGWQNILTSNLHHDFVSKTCGWLSCKNIYVHRIQVKLKKRHKKKTNTLGPQITSS